MNNAILIMPVAAILLVHACGLNEVNKSQSSDVTTNIKGNGNRVTNISIRAKQQIQEMGIVVR